MGRIRSKEARKNDLETALEGIKIDMEIDKLIAKKKGIKLARRVLRPLTKRR